MWQSEKLHYHDLHIHYNCGSAARTQQKGFMNYNLLLWDSSS